MRLSFIANSYEGGSFVSLFSQSLDHRYQIRSYNAPGTIACGVNGDCPTDSQRYVNSIPAVVWKHTEDHQPRQTLHSRQLTADSLWSRDERTNAHTASCGVNSNTNCLYQWVLSLPIDLLQETLQRITERIMKAGSVNIYSGQLPSAQLRIWCCSLLHRQSSRNLQCNLASRLAI